VQRRYADSPLSPIGEKIEKLIRETQEAIRSGIARFDQASQVANYVDRIMELLPQSFDERFYFDALMIKTLAEHWRQGAAQLSEMIIPRPSQTWGHRRVPLSEDKEYAHVIDVILFPGEDNLDDINLLEYPLLCHEIGHNVFFRCDETFIRRFNVKLDRARNALHLRAIADQGSTISKAQKIIEEINRFWRPTPDHHNWAHELAIDMIAL